MFRPISGHQQAVRNVQIKITAAKSVMTSQTETSVLGVTKCKSNIQIILKFSKQININGI
jgi:hypothetical protein